MNRIPVATGVEDDDKDDATINKWSKIRVTALKFNEYITYAEYIVLFIIFIGSIALVRDEYINIKFVIHLYSIDEFNQRKTKA